MKCLVVDCSVSGYYTTPYNPGYLSELTGIMAGDLAVGAGPGVQVQQQQEEENSDLEVWTSSPPSLPRSPGTPEI